MLLPAYDVFDETRYFDSDRERRCTISREKSLGISICEDAWNHEELWTDRLYERDPVSELAHKGATILINIAASPFHMDKENLRASLCRSHASRHHLPFIYVNQVGGNDLVDVNKGKMVLPWHVAERRSLLCYETGMRRC